MKKTELKNYIATEAKLHPDYHKENSDITVYPFKDIDTGDIRFSVAYYAKLQNSSNDKNHTLVLAYDGKEFYFWCGDRYIDNISKESKRKINLTEAKQMKKDALKTVKDNIAEAETLLDNLFQKEVESAGCHFWAKWKSKGEICPHVQHLFQLVDDENIIEELEEKYNYFMAVKPAAKKVASEAEKLKKYAFKKHVKITGPKGFGKTWGVYEFIDSLKIPQSNIFEIGGFEGLESVDLLGQNIPYVKEIKSKTKSITLKANNSFSSSENVEHVQDLVWLNGALSAAFKSASKGNKTVLLIDELYRIPARELSILVSSLTPDNKGFFTLRTRRVLGIDEDGCGIEEVIKAKKENLWVVATTNVGAGYDIDEVDGAVDDRFITIHKSAESDTLKSIVQSCVKERKFKVSLVSKLMEFYDKVERYNKSGELSKLINTRHLSEAIELADDEKDIVNVLKDMELKWIDRGIDGEPDEKHQTLIDKTLASIWS
jgi:hypothetical protein